jgi:hypothetical protein
MNVMKVSMNIDKFVPICRETYSNGFEISIENSSEAISDIGRRASQLSAAFNHYMYNWLGCLVLRWTRNETYKHCANGT